MTFILILSKMSSHSNLPLMIHLMEVLLLWRWRLLQTITPNHFKERKQSQGIPRIKVEYQYQVFWILYGVKMKMTITIKLEIVSLISINNMKIIPITTYYQKIRKPESPRGVSDFHKMTTLHPDKITHHDTTIYPENQTVAENRVIISSNVCNPYVFDRCNSADRSQISGCSAYSTPSIMAQKNRLRKIEEEFRTSYPHHVCDPCGAAT